MLLQILSFVQIEDAETHISAPYMLVLLYILRLPTSINLVNYWHKLFNNTYILSHALPDFRCFEKSMISVGTKDGQLLFLISTTSSVCKHEVILNKRSM